MMKGRICLITGANSGIGKAAALEIARKGATLVIVCRNDEKGIATVSEIRKQTGNDAVDYLTADLSSQAGVRKIASDFQKKYSHLHVLINNAGVYLNKRSVSTDGIEMTFATNHLAYFLLTNLLLDMLIASAPSRIINVSSEAHQGAHLNFDDLQGENAYDGYGAYKLSKLCNLLFTFELADRLKDENVTVNALHPGVVATGIFRHTPVFIRLPIKLMALNPETGAETTVHLATSTEVEGISGKYFIRKKEANPSSKAQDREAARRLWQISEQMVGLD